MDCSFEALYLLNSVSIGARFGNASLIAAKTLCNWSLVSMLCNKLDVILMIYSHNSKSYHQIDHFFSSQFPAKLNTFCVPSPPKNICCGRHVWATYLVDFSQNATASIITSISLLLDIHILKAFVYNISSAQPSANSLLFTSLPAWKAGM